MCAHESLIKGLTFTGVTHDLTYAVSQIRTLHRRNRTKGGCDDYTNHLKSEIAIKSFLRHKGAFKKPNTPS